MVPGKGEKERSVALVPAAGNGTRLGLGPKGLLEMGGRSLLGWVLESLNSVVDRIVVGVPGDFLEDFRRLAADRAEVIAGGNTRQATIRILMDISSEPLILIHDAARPFASAELCRSVLEAAGETGAAGAFLPTLVPVGIVADGKVSRAVPRSEAVSFQSPQAFRRDLLVKAYARAGAENCHYQSTAQMVLALGVPLVYVPGERTNVKVTTPWEWEIAHKVVLPLLAKRAEKKVVKERP